MEYVTPEFLSLKRHATLNERWLQAKLADDPSLLGLGDLILKDKERIQPGAGRLDLLLVDPENLRRYEVEVQLGRTDESHIIRTIEYWDIERRRYPQYDHCAVLVAEDVTSRFLNVISLFNGFIPLIVIQLRAVRMGDQVGLVATRVVDEMPLGLEWDDEQPVKTDRAYWEKKGSPATVRAADAVAHLIQSFAPGYQLNYNKAYVGLAKDGQALNFALLFPKKRKLRLALHLPESEETNQKIEDAGIDTMDYNRRAGRYRLVLTEPDVESQAEVITELLKEAYHLRASG